HTSRVRTATDHVTCAVTRRVKPGVHPRGSTSFAWLTRYNTRRRHSTNGYLSPNEYERRYQTAKLTLAA
ncbi:hypothetical protein, partial [Streptomyces hirsutus]|uniref:hypothetical protein n=1 Tax=Streptomyces hirsutus TaxID=35620 RepID=UPI0036625B15